MIAEPHDSCLIKLINQIHHLDAKIQKNELYKPLSRTVDAMKTIIAEAGYSYESPLNQRYNVMRVDLDAQWCGTSDTDGIIIDVIKPVIRHASRTAMDGTSTVAQKGVVLVKAEKEILK